MTTLAVMRARIADDITRTDLSSQITNAINDAIKLWEGERFAFNEKRYLINTVDGQEYYDLSGVGLLNHDESATATGEMVLEIDSITNTVNDYPYPLEPRTQQWFDTYQSLPTQYKGQPDSYGIYGNRLRLFPVPDASGPGVGGSFPIRVSCLARLGPNPLVNDGDTNDWLTEGEVLIRSHAKIILGRFPLRDQELIALAQNDADNAYTSLKRKMAAKAFTGRIAAWSL